MATPAGLTGDVRRAAFGLALLWTVGPSYAADRFVATTGADGSNDCLTSTAPCQTIGHAIAQAASGDEVKVRTGTYQEQVSVNAATTLTLSGGWALDFGSRDQVQHRTILARSAIGISAGGGQTIKITLDGLYFHTGISQGGALCPGPYCELEPAITAHGSQDGAIQLTVNDCQFVQAGGISVLHDGTGTVDLSVTGSRFTVGRGAAAGVSAFGGGSSTVRVTVEESMFTRGRAGGVLFDGNATPTRSLSVDRSVFTHNKGGAIAVETGFDSGSMTVAVTNSFMARNLAGRFAVAGMEIFGGSGATAVALVNDTLVQNSASSGDAGLFGCRSGGLWVGGFGTGNQMVRLTNVIVGSSRVDLQACKLEYSIVSPK